MGESAQSQIERANSVVTADGLPGERSRASHRIDASLGGIGKLDHVTGIRLRLAAGEIGAQDLCAAGQRRVAAGLFVGQRCRADRRRPGCE